MNIPEDRFNRCGGRFAAANLLIMYPEAIFYSVEENCKKLSGIAANTFFSRIVRLSRKMSENLFFSVRSVLVTFR